MHFKYKLALSTILIALLTQPAAAKLYKWVDDNGKTHYTDKLPPNQTDKARTEMNESGVEVSKIGRAKSPEEIAQEKELERLRKEREKLIEKQKADDSVLLRTFRSEDDIIMSQDGKLAAIDVMIEITKSNIRQSKAQLTDMQNSAASLERMGTKPSEKLLQDIANTKQQLQDSYAAIINREKDKERIRAKTQADLKRFRELKKLEMSQAPVIKSTAKKSQLDYVVPCPDPDTCNAYWERAKEYALKHATTKIEIMSESVIMTSAPKKDDGISITLSRIPKEGEKGENLFFDLQCRDDKEGAKFCESDEIKAIRVGFKESVLGKGNTGQQQTKEP